MRTEPVHDGTSAERGAALVEFTLVAVVLMTLALGTFEMGMGWSDGQLVTQAARTGARSAAQLGVDPVADAFAVESIETALDHLSGDVNRIVIFDAGAADGSMPPSCETATSPGIAGLCSVYDTSDYGTYGSWADGSWASTSRDNGFNTGDWVGVRIEVERPFVTAFFGARNLTINDTAVMRIEPEAGS